jgi:hypothetical protein
MLNKGTTWPPRSPARAQVLSGSKDTTTTDRLDRALSASQSATDAHGESRPAESHWEAIIDRATD